MKGGFEPDRNFLLTPIGSGFDPGGAWISTGSPIRSEIPRKNTERVEDFDSCIDRFGRSSRYGDVEAETWSCRR